MESYVGKTVELVDDTKKKKRNERATFESAVYNLKLSSYSLRATIVEGNGTQHDRALEWMF